MADAERFAEFLAISASKIPPYPDKEPDPKGTLIALARMSRNRRIREEMVPREGSGAQVGKLYAPSLNKFTSEHWRPEVAANHSESLRRCLNALAAF